MKSRNQTKMLNKIRNRLKQSQFNQSGKIWPFNVCFVKQFRRQALNLIENKDCVRISIKRLNNPKEKNN